MIATTDSGKEEANLAHDSYVLTVTCMDYESSSTCYSVSNVDWYFDSGATKHITSCKKLFSTLRDAPHGGSVFCANDASYAIKGIGDVDLISCSGDTFTLVDALYVPGIRKNLIFVSALAKAGFKVQFSDHCCSIYDRQDSDSLMLFGSLCHGLYKLDMYDKASASYEDAMVASTSTSLSDIEL